MVVQLTPDNSNLQGESKKRFELLGVQVSEGEIIKKITSSKKHSLRVQVTEASLILTLTNNSY